MEICLKNLFVDIRAFKEVHGRWGAKKSYMPATFIFENICLIKINMLMDVSTFT